MAHTTLYGSHYTICLKLHTTLNGSHCTLHAMAHTLHYMIWLTLNPTLYGSHYTTLLCRPFIKLHLRTFVFSIFYEQTALETHKEVAWVAVVWNSCVMQNSHFCDAMQSTESLWCFEAVYLLSPTSNFKPFIMPLSERTKHVFEFEV